jgi:hypothetical protein
LIATIFGITDSEKKDELNIVPKYSYGILDNMEIRVIVNYPGELDFDVKELLDNHSVDHTVRKTGADTHELSFIPKVITDYLIKVFAEEVKCKHKTVKNIC